MKNLYLVFAALFVLSIGMVSATGGGHGGSFSLHSDVSSETSVESSSSHSVASAWEHSGHGHESSHSFASASESSFSFQHAFHSVLDVARTWDWGCWHWC